MKLTKELMVHGLSKLSVVYPVDTSEAFYEVYWDALRDMTAEDFQRGVTVTLRKHRFANFPSPAVIWENGAITDADKRANIAILRLEQAWAKGIDCHHNVDFGDPALHAVIEQFGGWVQICNLSQKEWRFVRKDLMKSYSILCQLHDAHFSYPEVLWGEHGDAENILRLRQRGKEPKITLVKGVGKGIKQIPLTEHLNRVAHEKGSIQQIEHKHETEKTA